MAEARSIADVRLGLATGRSGGVQLFQSDDGITISVTVPKPRVVGKEVKRKAMMLRNVIVTSFFPLGIIYVAAIVAVFIAVVLRAEPESWWRSGWIATQMWHVAHWVPGFGLLAHKLKLVVLASVAGMACVLALLIVQRYLTRVALGWHGWMYVERGTRPVHVVLYMAVVKVLMWGADRALTYSYQGSLPRLPLPSLQDTTDRYLESIRPLRTDEEFAHDEAEVAAFLAAEGPRLQRYLWLKSIWAANYVSDWWEKYVYLRGRSPLMINSNYYINDSSEYRATPSVAARAGDIIEGMLEYMRMLEHETLEVQLIQDTIPLCMNQSRRIFATTRIPGLECDTLVHLEAGESRHIVVLYRGIFTLLPLMYKGHLLDGYQIQHQFAALMEAVDEHIAEHGEPGTEARIGALTAGNRTRWAEVREEHFSTGPNRDALASIERALFFVALDDAEPTTDAEMGRLNFTGRGFDRWFDKSITLILYANGVMGVNCEHSWADALCSGHMVEYVMTRHFNRPIFDEDGSIRPSSSFTKLVPYLGTPLKWDLTVAAQAAVEDAVIFASSLIADVALDLYCHGWGKDRIKGCKMSPDAFVQMAMQLAYYRDQGRLCLTYEASTTRLFRDGRTETVRTGSPLVAAWIATMDDPDATPGERVAALRAAVDAHVLKFKDAMTGKGVDRHLFALYVVSVGRSISSPFLNHAIAQPWMLSTSQQPQHQTKNWDPVKNPEHGRRVSAGGGFGPVADDGYGVSYMLAGASRIYFHVSSKVSSPATDSPRFVARIARALEDMASLVECDVE